ncbi:hypothetical protein [Nocardia arthritidis]|uniref:hypothetical protein n=1 Tax=Nocardia arthritidis TaxID=228602 RepID=UPI000A77CA80|nr:hypothetical protein [Nocardia arthritidis]
MHSRAIHQLAAMPQQEDHQAPRAPFTTEQAHRIMQFHIACRARKCPRKAAALQALAEAGRLKPSSIHPR